MTKTIPAYTAPKLTQVGSLEGLTQGQSTGSKLDASQATGTAAGALTFS